ncbi:putative lysosomal cystine transporter [Medicago truncatula]|uniref:Cystinosin homolog n=1 Tax=Medicago truncatula TaxID=3880 RepID=A0A072U6W8_MEDTR|nr:cystinosin homolog [Medicago truncatula]KEH25387.1 cystinosin-like protein [Medicago truncatula]RHN50520.1 putative lysosomal cystine transporter [Medicago truncatula]
MEETAWNSETFKIAYTVFGWIAFVVWSSSFYPQFILNYSRKSVVGLNFNYLILNNTKHTLYLIYNASLYFSPNVRFQYHQKYGFDQMIPVAANDVAFSTHAVLLTLALLFQVAIYERGNQSISKITMGIITVVWITVGVCSFIAFPSKSWLWLISIFNTMQVVLATIKYIPQAFMNFMIKSTDGFSIGNVFLDFCGGMANYAQMVIQSIDQNSWVNFSGNLGKVLLSLVCMFFDLLFMCQHYVLYPSKKTSSISPSKLNDKIKEPLIKSPSNVPVAENV